MCFTNLDYGRSSWLYVLFSCNPVFALLFSYLILRERLGRANLISVVISVIGLLIIMLIRPIWRMGWAAISHRVYVTFGLYSIISRYGSVKRGLNGLTMICFTFFAGAFELLVLAWLLRFRLSPMGWWPSVCGNCCHSVLVNVNLNYFWLLFYRRLCYWWGFAFYFLAMEQTDVSTAS